MTTTPAPPPAATREAYGPALVKLAEAGYDIVALDADLSASTGGNKLAGSFPDRWFTVGAAEANMISIAAGLASTGKTVYAASFAVFMPGHCFDQIRVHIAQQRMNVKLIASHGGISVGEDGASAQAIEDLALMTSLPGMNVVVPCDAVEADAMICRAAEDNEPWYIRLGRPKLPVIYTEGAPFQLGNAHQLRDGSDVTLIACGLMVEPTLRAADVLAAEGVSARVLNMATIKPLDEAAVIRAAADTGAVVCAEEHNIIGGLGSAVARTLALHRPTPMEQVGINDTFGQSGPWQALLSEYGLTADSVVDAAKRAIARK
ncbi:MAG: transketolase family protein [Chloroflexi bacterium]|nr:transketolase family protein [Chloroflexota bacterium]MYG90886.1 transketolase family protein [Chloroflexota bacterium]MYJ93567.1 transketolase family protein [Chloroflexota bacterium]